MATNPSAKELLDHISTFELGMNGGMHPTLVPRNQLCFALNTTVRAGIAKHRPSMKRYFQMIWDSPLTQENVETGLFQGACYYKPDSGHQCIIASISGRLFQFEVSGSIISVSDISIPGDANPQNGTQAWLWQAEKWVIVNDGVSLPIFYDGNVSRRSAGPSIEINKVASVDQKVPLIGDTFIVTMTAGNYLGPYNVPILFHGEFYVAVDQTDTYSVNLTSLYDEDASHPIRSEVVIQPSIAGYITAAIFRANSPSNIPANTLNYTFELSSPYTGSIGSLVTISTAGINPIIWRILSVSGKNITVTNNEILHATAGANNTWFNYLVGTVVEKVGVTTPNSIVTRLNAVLYSAPSGTTTTVAVKQPYTGSDGQVVFIEGAQFTIGGAVTTVATPSASGTVVLRNLSDAVGTDISAIITAGGPLSIMSVPELPAGRMGCFGMGQNWVSQVDGLAFICGDISRGPSGTAAHDYRDSVLKTVDLTFGGGAFAIPSAGSPITSMTFISKLDESIGQGPLQIGTAAGIFSIQAPFDFFAIDTNKSSQAQTILPETLKGAGPLGQNSTINVNSDLFFRNQFGIGTLVLGRRDFQSAWGNTNASDEVDDRVLSKDQESLLQYGTAVNFDNRMIMTCSPTPSNAGVVHQGAVVINLDPASSLQGRTSPVYDGLWTGLNLIQFVSGMFDGENRCFAFGYNIPLAKIEIYELLPTLRENIFDNSYIPITWGFESGALFGKDVKPPEQLVRLLDGEFAVDNVVGRVAFKVWYRFDEGCWFPWHQFSICAEAGSEPQSYARLGLGKPLAGCDTVDESVSTEGYSLQVKFEITGSCRFLRGRFKAITVPSPEFQPPICNAGCTI